VAPQRRTTEQPKTNRAAEPERPFPCSCPTTQILWRPHLADRPFAVFFSSVPYLGEVELEPDESELLPELPLLPEAPELPELLGLRSDPLEPELLPPGVYAPPVAELLPDRPK